MSSIDINFKTNSSRKVIETLVQQGQRLRNAMVETLLSYDPFDKEILVNNPNSNITLNIKSDPSLAEEQNCFCNNQNKMSSTLGENNIKMEGYIKKHIKPDEESRALEILRSMSLNNCTRPYTSRFYKGCCEICDEYESKVFSADVAVNKRSEPNISLLKRKDSTKVTMKKEKYDVLHYVDSLRVQVYSLRLNNAGLRKASEDESSARSATSKTYCVEYILPEELRKPALKTGARVDSGLKSDKIVRLCARHERDRAVYFKQRSVHPLRNLTGLNLFGVHLSFKIGWRRVGQRMWHTLGVAEVDLGPLIHSQSLSLEQELTIIGDAAPVVLGSIKVSLQFGCDGLYFGREFVDAMRCSKENINLSESDSIYRMSDSEQNGNESPTIEKVLKSSNAGANDNNVKRVEKSSNKIEKKQFEKSTETSSCSVDDYVVAETSKDSYLLHALIKVYGARILCSKQSDLYLVSHGLSGNDITVSRATYLSDNKLVFNLRQLIPVQYNEKFLDRLRDNFIVLEVRQGDRLLGIAKLSVHNLYMAYRNPAIVKLVLTHNTDATVVVDGWEPITEPISGQAIGEISALVALGTRQQIENLETFHLFEKKTQNLHKSHLPQNEPVEYVSEVQSDSEPTPHTAVIEKTDACTQFDLAMDQTSPPTDFLSCFLEQLIELNHRTNAKMIESSTNTDVNEGEIPKSGQPVIRNTSELLDTLQQALVIPDSKVPQKNDSNTTDEVQIDTETYFKAHMIIESALHLPGNGRRRYKNRKNKSRNANETLPSTYVTFQPRPDTRAESTPLAMRTTSPRWDFRKDMHLPADLLLQSSKRLIFRVWKSAGGTRPDPRIDTVLGFAALDLTVLLSGLPAVHGWFNIVDFANKCNGQIKIHVTPLESLSRFSKASRTSNEPIRCNITAVSAPLPPSEDPVPAELLSRALKRKLTELDEITQRLKQRLSAVTEPDSDDDFADEFERDLNTVCSEPDQSASMNDTEETQEVDSLSVEERTKNESRITELDQHLARGKLKIDSLLEKLSLLGNETQMRTSFPDALAPTSSTTSIPTSSVSVAAPFANRYVSGCSLHEGEYPPHDLQVLEDIGEPASESNVLKDIGLDSHQNIDPDLIFNPLLFQQMFTASLDSTPRLVQCTTLSGLVNESEDNRRAPDGAGV